jgi:hypothetical protein
MEFVSNYGVDILIDQRGSATLTGPDSSGDGFAVGSVTGRAGIEIAQDPSLGALTRCVLSGLASTDETAGVGLLVHGGSLVTVRGCTFVRNLVGVSVQPFAGSPVPAWSNDTSGIDLGGNTTDDAGANVMQQQGSDRNTLVGPCVGTNASTQLSAQGNVWADGDGGAAVDCRDAGTTLSTVSGCDAGPADIAPGASQVGSTLRIDGCH